MPQSYPNYVAGKPDGNSTGEASIGGAGVATLGSRINTLSAAGASRNVLDDGAGNVSIAGNLSVSGTFPTVSGNLALTGTLAVTGAATFFSTVAATGLVTGVGGFATNPTPAATPTFASGVTIQNPNAYDSRVSVLVSSTGGTGTYAVVIGPTAGVTYTIGTFTQATGQNLPFSYVLPASWYIKITLTTLSFTGAPLWV